MKERGKGKGSKLGVRMHYVVPSDVHGRAKAAARYRGMFLRDYLIDALEKAAAVDQEAMAKDPKQRYRRDHR